MYAVGEKYKIIDGAWEDCVIEVEQANSNTIGTITYTAKIIDDPTLKYHLDIIKNRYYFSSVSRDRSNMVRLSEDLDIEECM